MERCCRMEGCSLLDLSVWWSEYWVVIVTSLLNFWWLYLEYRASVWLWPVGIVLPIFWIVVSWQAHFYGNVVINVYYLISSAIGWFVWLRSREEQGGYALPISSIPRRELYRYATAGVLVYPMACFLLTRYTDSLLPWADAYATVASFVGMVWLARKWYEHWLCWIQANAVSLVIFLVAEDYVSAFVFAVNLVVSIMGYCHWKRQYREGNIKTTTL